MIALAAKGAAFPEVDSDGFPAFHDDVVDLGRIQDHTAGLNDLATQRVGHLVGTALAIALVHHAIEIEGYKQPTPVSRGSSPHMQIL